MGSVGEGGGATCNLTVGLLIKVEASDTSRFSVSLQSNRFPRQNVAIVLLQLHGNMSNDTCENVEAQGVLVTTPK